MLQGLFNNKNVERILLFLFVNERCYGAQLQSLLGCPLTPIQKALLRLEKDGVIYSRYEGKTRIYYFQPSYPLRSELEMLLKKAYTLLPVQEKKKFCFIHKPRLTSKGGGTRERNRRNELLAFWNKLIKTQKLLVSAKSKTGENSSTQSGKAEVLVTAPAPNILIFQEKGFWLSPDFPDTAFSNSFRWTLDLNASLIALEHLRYGATHPVFLLHFTPTKHRMLESVDAHFCAQDTYLGNITWDADSIDFHWRILGPHKNNHLLYRYT